MYAFSIDIGHKHVLLQMRLYLLLQLRSSVHAQMTGHSSHCGADHGVGRPVRGQTKSFPGTLNSMGIGTQGKEMPSCAGC